LTPPPFPYTTLFRSLGRLEELPRLTPPLELVPSEKMIRLTVPLARPRLACGGGHRVPEAVGSPSPQLARDRRLAAPGRGGEHDHARGGRHSRLSSCSRNFSSSPFMAITVCAIPASLAFDPMVFTSRNSSCARNPSCFPTAPSVASAVRHAARGVRNRTSSSVMSTRSA